MLSLKHFRRLKPKITTAIYFIHSKVYLTMKHFIIKIIQEVYGYFMNGC
jgi:hypothetical protein